MTGTAKTEEEEFRQIYNMDVVVIPTNLRVNREDMQDDIFYTKRKKGARLYMKYRGAMKKDSQL